MSDDGFPLEGGHASKQPWVVLPPGTPAVSEYYDREQLWPAASLARRQALLTRSQHNG